METNFLVRSKQSETYPKWITRSIRDLLVILDHMSTNSLPPIPPNVASNAGATKRRKTDLNTEQRLNVKTMSMDNNRPQISNC